MCCVLLPVPVQFFLMLAMGNDYLLYYIVPLHTFYFLVVYLTMAIAPRLNRTKWGIRGKLAVLAVTMYCRTSVAMCSHVWMCVAMLVGRAVALWPLLTERSACMCVSVGGAIMVRHGIPHHRSGTWRRLGKAA